MMRIAKRILLVFAILFAAAQLFRPEREVPAHEPSTDLLHMTQPPAEVEALVRAACYDCHSYETKYPWYAAITPVNWFLQDHIDHARRHLNFSCWDRDGRSEDAAECGEVVRSHEMPLESYLPLHPEAQLTDAQLEQLATWFDRVTQGAGEEDED
ncbi:MAG: heme-binding domain-containing protein [Flavobacteriales bacterium]|nr:heme-binding domain-containing protein [Flavobacteriales bacterium]